VSGKRIPGWGLSFKKYWQTCQYFGKKDNLSIDSRKHAGYGLCARMASSTTRSAVYLSGGHIDAY
jgi:hypothetical protein